MTGPAIPLTSAADAALARLAHETGSGAIAALDGATLLGERATLMGSRVPGRVSAGGGCRLIGAADDMIALNLARPCDRELLPALFEDGTLDPQDDAAIDDRVLRRGAEALVSRARTIGLPIAQLGETPACRAEPCERLAEGAPASTRRDRPRVIDLTALWAGPLATHLLGLSGCDILKIESPARPDAMREGQPDFHALLNRGKRALALDLRNAAGRDALLACVAEADIVIEAARPRAMAQLGIDVAAIVRETPGLVWLTITAHGATGEAANWVGFGDDVGVAAGLSAALRDVTGRTGFVGDAIADPLTGIHAALHAWSLWRAGAGGHYGLGMRDVVARCLADERTRDPLALDRDLQRWAAAEGEPFAPVRRRGIVEQAPQLVLERC